MKRWVVLCWYAMATAVSAQGAGGLYIAGTNFDFTQAVERAIAQNPTPSKFFVLATGDAVRGLSVVARPELVEVRNRGAARGAVYLVCRRDVERDAFQMTDLIAGVVAVKGWPAPGSGELPEGTNYYRGEDPSHLPSSTEQLRRLRSTCS
ncbi:MAG TPA: hypothetical protein VNA44_04605 [Burkholderiaceae bacterium]|nr:hypothetical protein [Burkholderiaceae bacterium]